MRHRRPLGLLYLPSPAGEDLARMAGMEGMTRAIMVGSVPLAALEGLGSKEAVSYAFVAGSILAVLVTVNVGRLEQVVPRRWVLTGGVGAVFLAALLFAFGPTETMPLAIGLQATHASLFSVCLSLYMMEHIGKGDFTGAESRRAVYLATAWLIGPTAGTWLWSNVGRDVPFLISMAASVLLVVYHWRLRSLRNPVLMAPMRPVPSPMVTIPRFFRQRNLRIAYAVTVTRSTFWAALFVYGPIYVVEAGLPPWAAGVFLSLSAAVLFLGPAVRRGADRFGVRSTVIFGFVMMTISLTLLTVTGEPQPIGLVWWIIGAVGGGIVDVLGNIPFMRLVKPRERGPMASVFSTWREVSFLIAPALAAAVLVIGPFWMLYGVLAALTALGGVTASYLPRRL